MLCTTKVATLMFVWALVDSCSITIIVDSSKGIECTSECLVANQSVSVCKDLETVLQCVASQSALIQQPDDCIQVNIMPGNYTITSPLRFSTNLVLSSAGISSGVQVTFQVPVNQSSEPFYVMVFSNVEYVVLNGVDFTTSPGIIGFENVTNVTITSCSFSFFDQGAVDMFNCAYPRVELCNFMHNGPTNITKSQIYLGHSGGLSIGFNYERKISFNPYVHLSNCTFINNSVNAVNTELDDITIRERLFPGRGGGASVIFNAINAISVMIEWCYFRANFALGYGGGICIIPNGHTNHTIIVNNTKFINNKSQRGGGLQIGFIDPGALNRVIYFFTYNTEFIGNTASYGGGLEFVQSHFIRIAGDHGVVEKCTFQTNYATNFGAAVAITTLNLFNTRERVTAFEIVNCTFTSNTAANKAGVVGVSYFALRLQGLNLFIDNRGSVMTVVGTVVYISAGSNVQVINNTNAGDGGAFNLESLGQIVLSSDVLVIFEGNVGRFGAAIAKESLRYLPESFYEQILNPLCFIRHIDSSKPPSTWKNENISIIFENNTAAVGAAIYSDNAALCSWIQLQEPFFNKTEYFRSSAVVYRNNRNTGHAPDDYDTLWDVQSPSVDLTIHNTSISMYPGQTFLLNLTTNDDFGNPTISVIRLLDSDYIEDENNNGQVSITFSKTAALIDQNVSMATFQTSFYTHVSDDSPNSIDAISIFTSYKYTTRFNISALDCPSGTVLGSSQSFGSCQCNFNNTYIIECRGSNILFVNGFWASESNEPGMYGDHVTVYPCPIGYCRCEISAGICESSTNFEDIDKQCSCSRSGVLCGDCDANMGVSALMNQCVTCSDVHGLLIAALVVIDTFVFIFLIMVPFAFPSWLYSCLFYIQLLPIVTEHFPVTFTTIRPYLYYVSSGLSFYFVYDFCLYSNMSPLVSYFIRYLPLFTAIIVCPTILAIRFKRSHHSQWHGLWWIVLLMYTHTVYTSMSILNCPRLPRENDEFSNVWYINGNIECFSGWHAPLAVLAILVVLICLAAIPVTLMVSISNSKNWRLPILIQHCIRNLAPALMEGIKDEVRWFGSVELLRRIVAVLLIVAVPWNEYLSIFLIIIILFAYGYVQPYKSMISNVLEVVLAIDVLILLGLKNSNQIASTVQSQQLNDTISAGANCTVEITGISPLVAALTPFYYFPLLVTMLGGVMCVCRVLHGCILKGKVGHFISRSLSRSVSEVGISLEGVVEEEEHSTSSFTTSYMDAT